MQLHLHRIMAGNLIRLEQVYNKDELARIAKPEMSQAEFCLEARPAETRVLFSCRVQS